MMLQAYKELQTLPILAEAPIMLEQRSLVRVHAWALLAQRASESIHNRALLLASVRHDHSNLETDDRGVSEEVRERLRVCGCLSAARF